MATAQELLAEANTAQQQAQQALATSQARIAQAIAALQPPAPEPTPTPPPPGPVVKNLFGISAGEQLGNIPAAERAKWLDDMVRIGVQWVRTDFVWAVAEPTQGTKVWSSFDAIMADCNARNLKVIATIGYTPAWANGGHSDHAYEPLSPEQFGVFAGEVAARYAPQGLHAYEIWNEPNIGFWKPLPNPARYALTLNAAYEAIHKADPNATVITGGSSPAGNGTESWSPQTWLKELYAHSARFDAVGHHPYVDGNATAGQLPNAWQLMTSEYPPENLRGVMLEHADSTKQIWATEVGCKRSLGETVVAERLTLAAAKWKSYTFAGALCWFTYWDPNEYGLVDGEYKPRAAYTALQAACGTPPSSALQWGINVGSEPPQYDFWRGKGLGWIRLRYPLEQRLGTDSGKELAPGLKEAAAHGLKGFGQIDTADANALPAGAAYNAYAIPILKEVAAAMVGAVVGGPNEPDLKANGHIANATPYGALMRSLYEAVKAAGIPLATANSAGLTIPVYLRNYSGEWVKRVAAALGPMLPFVNGIESHFYGTLSTTDLSREGNHNLASLIAEIAQAQTAGFTAFARANWFLAEYGWEIGGTDPLEGGVPNEATQKAMYAESDPLLKQLGAEGKLKAAMPYARGTGWRLTTAENGSTLTPAGEAFIKGL